MGVSGTYRGEKFDLILKLSNSALQLLLLFQMVSVVTLILVVPVRIDLMQLKYNIKYVRQILFRIIR